MESLYLISLTLLLTVTTSADPLVTLYHGGQLRGKSFNYDGLSMELFLGIRYADAPVGALRFQKPRVPRPWSGIKDVNSSSHECPQLSTFTGEFVGDEDCLFMDITVPGGVDVTSKRPVMMFIHGGGYIAGSKDAYLGAPLAKHGDVIVVTINYRVDILGFLSNGLGSGNFGLWDQRAALLWIQKNIAEFGGDPKLVTIFGESAGAGSVAALTMGQHTRGLFKRAIQESGSLYDDWGWNLSEREICETVEAIKEVVDCPPTDHIYDCLRELSLERLFEVRNSPPASLLKNVWHPTPDSDFFNHEVLDEGYDLTKRFDLLSGFNGQEGGLSVIWLGLSNLTQESIDDGVSESFAQQALEYNCKAMTPLTVDFCMDFYTSTYGLNTTADGKERAKRLTYAFGETSFNVDAVRQLVAHSGGDKSTYAYQFIERFSPLNSLLAGSPPWLKESAYHGDELPFVFGGIYSKEHNISEEYHDKEITGETKSFLDYFNLVSSSDKPLTDLMMTMWTNFAKTGNPNSPVSLPVDIPVWPEFNTLTNQFMELNSTNTRVITTPHKDRLDKLAKTLLPLRHDQLAADKDCSGKEGGKDTVVG